MKKITVTVEVSARHLHLRQSDVVKIFGKNYQLRKWQDISMKGQYATHETCQVIGKRGQLAAVRVVGPERPQSQLELAASDCYFLGIKPFYKVSGDLRGAPRLLVKGPCGSARIPVIVPLRHIHISDKLAKKYGLSNGQKVKVSLSGVRSLLFEEVIVRIHPTFRFRLHLDTDEGNAAAVRSGQRGLLIK